MSMTPSPRASWILENKKKKVASFDDQDSNLISEQALAAALLSCHHQRNNGDLISEQALAAALLSCHHQRNNGDSPPFPISKSVVYPSPGPKKQGFTKSSSSRPRSHPDSPMIKNDGYGRGIGEEDGVEKGIAPSVETYNTLVNDYGRLLLFSRCFQVLEEMEGNGGKSQIVYVRMGRFLRQRCCLGIWDLPGANVYGIKV